MNTRLTLGSRSAIARLLAAAACAFVVGCGADDGGASGDGAAATGGGDAAGGQVDLAAAEKYIAPYTSASQEFPFTKPLSKRPDPGTEVVFLDLGTPVTALVWKFLQSAGTTAGVKVRRVKTGNDAQSINAALNSVVESRPDAVIDVALDPTLFTPQLERLREQGTVFVPASIVNGSEFDFEDRAILGGREQSIEAGRILAAGILAQTEGKSTRFVFYNVPELPFSNLQQTGAQEKMKELCPACELRTVDIPIARLGTTASQLVVSDLQKNPDTQAFITPLDEIQIGLPAAQRVARLEVPGLGQNPSPINYQQVKSGEQQATFVIDTHMYTWAMMDQALRELAGEEVRYPPVSELGFYRILDKETAPDDPEEGFIAFEDYKERFSDLWSGQ